MSIVNQYILPIGSLLLIVIGGLLEHPLSIVISTIGYVSSVIFYVVNIIIFLKEGRYYYVGFAIIATILIFIVLG